MEAMESESMSKERAKKFERAATKKLNITVNVNDHMAQVAAAEAAKAAEELAEAETLRKEEVDEQKADAIDGRPPTAEERRAMFWKKQEASPVWHVTLNKRYAWHAEDEEQLGEAMARCRAQGKTPLLLDGSRRKDPNSQYEPTRLDEWFILKGAELLEARKMVEDETLGTRKREQVLKEARKQLVSAMRDGCTFYIRLGQKQTEFLSPAHSEEEVVVGKGYNGDDTLPLSLFDAKKLAELEPHTEGVAFEPVSLWNAAHPFAKLLRPNDLALRSNDFVVRNGFGVVVCSQKGEDEYARALAGAVPLDILQPIHVRVLSYLQS
eukprot:5758427-Prymnesium_polylepis.1